MSSNWKIIEVPHPMHSQDWYCEYVLYWKHGTVTLCSNNETYEFATDVACRFMDAWNKAPSGTNPFDLVQSCYIEAKHDSKV